jgi:hypothetical protein
MSENQVIISNGNDFKQLLVQDFVKSAITVILGWLGEMDGETTEEDWRFNTHHSRLDGKISCLSFQKVFTTSPGPVYPKQ